jgi:hypothetical protein
MAALAAAALVRRRQRSQTRLCCLAASVWVPGAWDWVCVASASDEKRQPSRRQSDPYHHGRLMSPDLVGLSGGWQ